MVANGSKKLDLSVLGLEGELPKEANVRRQVVALFRAEGHSAEEIAQRLGTSVQRIELILADPQTTEQVFRFQRTLDVPVKQKVKLLAHAALETKAWLMLHSSNDNVRNAASTDILDRAEGKPAQTIINHNFNSDQPLHVLEDNLKQVQERLAQAEAQRAVLLKRQGEIKDAEVVG